MTILWFDTETFSECDLFSAGTHRYAAHESTEIMVAQWAIGEGDPEVQDCTRDIGPNGELSQLLRHPDVQIVAHNSAFDRTLVRHCWGIDVPIERWRDTMVLALAHGLPGGLEKVGQALGVANDVAKDKRGKELIQLFCKPRPKNMKLRRATRETHPAEWAEFLEYSRQDIIAMRHLHELLPHWNYREGHPELALWHLDQRINDRGFCVDLDFARASIEAVGEEQERLREETAEATDGLVSSPSKRDQLLKFILAEYGVALPDMKADTLRRRVEDPNLPDGVRLLLSLRLEATKASTAKFKALVKSTSADGRLRNTLQFAGAQRTARWAGRIFQPQNMPRPDEAHIANHFGLEALPKSDEAKHALVLEYERQGVAAVKGGFATYVFDDVMQLTSNLVRGCIVAAPGRKLCVADLANIEGRGLVWLAGERWKLKAFAEYDAGTGPDLYKLAYARSFGVDPSEAVGQKRQIGKVQELGLGYEGGVAAFLTFAAVYRMDLEDMAEGVWASASREAIDRAQGMLAWVKKQRRSTFGLPDRVYIACEILKASWREAHPAVVSLWNAAADGVRQACANPGQVVNIGRHLAARRDAAWLRIRLPSGRYLCYLHPEVSDSGEITYQGVDQYTRQWKRIKTYGGKLVENCTQAFARDVLADPMQRIDDSGYLIVLTVHDEVLTETEDNSQFSAEALGEMMATRPSWAPGIPLSAAGFETYRYRKE
jgi:DNA polymerase